MSRCIKCGGPLPPLGDCSKCRGDLPAGRRVPQLLSRELKLDRRTDTSGIDQRPPPRPPPSIPRGAPPPPPPPPSGPGAGPGAEADLGASAQAEAVIHASVAPLWRRAGAALVDLGAVLAMGAVYLTIAASVAGVQPPSSQLPGLDALMMRVRALEPVLLPSVALILLLACTYSAVFGWLGRGRTLGRRLFGLQLVDLTGLPPTPARALARGVLSLLSFVLFLGGFWLMLFDRKGQTLHDKLTSTFVVRPG
jgi:uncharacterized RDD family membrane protein YckC